MWVSVCKCVLGWLVRKLCVFVRKVGVVVCGMVCIQVWVLLGQLVIVSRCVVLNFLWKLLFFVVCRQQCKVIVVLVLIFQLFLQKLLSMLIDLVWFCVVVVRKKVKVCVCLVGMLCLSCRFVVQLYWFQLRLVEVVWVYQCVVVLLQVGVFYLCLQQ